jgi:hypothetical protein
VRKQWEKKVGRGAAHFFLPLLPHSGMSSAGFAYPIVLGYCNGVKCPIHHVELICYCPACRGSVTSRSKARASRQNGKLGGRPKGSRNKPKSKTASKGRTE